MSRELLALIGVAGPVILVALGTRGRTLGAKAITYYSGMLFLGGIASYAFDIELIRVLAVFGFIFVIGFIILLFTILVSDFKS